MYRSNCNMCHSLGDVRYCDYYDVFYMECSELDNCPDGLDEEDEDYEEDEFYDEYYENNY